MLPRTKFSGVRDAWVGRAVDGKRLGPIGDKTNICTCGGCETEWAVVGKVLKGRWDQQLADLAAETGAWPDRTISDFLQDRLAEDEQQVLIIDKDLKVTARQIHDRSRILANWLLARGYQPGDVISFQLPSWWEAVIVGMAAAMTGLVLHPLLPIYREGELEFMLRDIGSKLLFIPGEFRGHDYARMVRGLSFDIDVVVVRTEDPEWPSLDAILASALPDLPLPDVDANAVRVAMYTSGTTGRPKCVLHTHNTIHADIHRLVDFCGLGKSDCVFFPGPISHIGGIITAVNLPFYLGVPTCLLDIWETSAAFDLLKRHDCSYAAGPTPFLRGLVDEARQRGDTLPSLRFWMCGGAAVPPSLIHDARDTFPSAKCWRVFGATEAPMVTAPPQQRDSSFAAETDGRIYRANVRLVVPGTDDDCADGEEGEILVKTESMFVGYLYEEDNAAAFDGQGYLRMGDLGRIVDGEWLVVTGRIKDLIIRNGENISAKEIEDALITHDLIREVAVVGTPSDRTGEAVCAFVVLDAGGQLTLADMTAWLSRNGLAKYKSPEFLYIVDELPINTMGKILKRKLRDMAKDLTATEVRAA